MAVLFFHTIIRIFTVVPIKVGGKAGMYAHRMSFKVSITIGPYYTTLEHDQHTSDFAKNSPSLGHFIFVSDVFLHEKKNIMVWY